jgi:hypothetical protein
MNLLLFGYLSLVFSAPIFDMNESEPLSVKGELTDYFRTWSTITFPYAENCNATQMKYIDKYYQDMLEVSSIAREHLIQNGTDEIFEHWFGQGNLLTVLGVIDNIVQGDKAGVLYRCDDIDGGCAEHLTTWPGYHRSTAENETVLCDLFFTSKRPIEDMCNIGDILEVEPKTFAGIDLFHRFLHLESINKGFVSEYTETFEEIVDYAKENNTYAVINTDNILYYLAEAYSVSLASKGCLGQYPSE